MIGNDFFGDLEIDAIQYEKDIESVARDLIDHWGKDLTEKDLLKLKAYGNCSDTPIQCALAKAALEYYLTQDFKPEFIHAGMDTSPKTKWWQFWKQ